MNYLQKKKLAFMSIVNRIKGFVRRVSGAVPLTLPDCADRDSIISYTMSGNSVQNGTPTPENPVEVKSVGEYDEETGEYKIPVVCSDEKGNSVTTSIYLDEPLREISSYSDYIDFENQKVVRKIASEYITTVATKSSQSKTYGVFMSDISKKPLMLSSGFGYAVSNKFAIFSTMGLSSLGNNPHCIMPYITSGKQNRIAYTFDDTSITTVAQATEAIKEGFEACYVLAEEEETPITLPKLPTFKGTTVYRIDTSIQPSNMSATYYATSKE